MFLFALLAKLIINSNATKEFKIINTYTSFKCSTR